MSDKCYRSTSVSKTESIGSTPISDAIYARDSVARSTNYGSKNFLCWCSGQTYPPFKRGDHRFKSDTEDQFCAEVAQGERSVVN
jgi:hypothetical protein